MDVDQILKQLEDAIKRAGGSQADQRRALQNKIKSLALDKDNHEALKKLTKDQKKASEIQKDLNLSSQDLNKAIDQSIQQYDALGDSIKDAGSATIGFGKAIYRGEGTISSYTDVVAGKFGLIGDTIAGTGKLLDTNIEMFRQLSRVGANFGQSIVQLRQAAAASALPLTDFVDLVGTNSQALAALSGSTTQGAQFVAGLGNALRTDAVPQLATLGFTVDEINETLLLNLERQRRFNTLDQNATTNNIDSAIRFAKQLDTLSKLTGIQRDQLRAQIESQQSNSKFAAFLQGQTQAAADRLQGFAGVIGEIAPGLNEGFQDLIANAGVPVTEAALSVVQNIPEARGVIQNLINGVVSSEQALVQIRDASSKSIDRFRSATVTGQVEFLALQSDVINLGRRLVDVQAVLDETAPQLADSLTSGLTQFEDASKRVGAATQSLETAALSFVGNLVGDASGLMNSGLTGLSKAILGLPGFIAAGLYGTSKLLQGGLALLKDTGPTYLAVRAGVAAGMQGGGMLGGLRGGARGFAKGASGFLGKGALAGAGLLGLGASNQLASQAETTEDKLMGVGGMALSGAAIGAAFGGIGAPVGAVLGGLYGAYKAFGGKRQYGGGMDAGKIYLTGENGPELKMENKKSAVVANQDLRATFNTEALESKMNNMVTELNNANKALTNMVSSVNTLVAVESRALKAVETTARKDWNTIGNV